MSASDVVTDYDGTTTPTEKGSDAQLLAVRPRSKARAIGLVATLSLAQLVNVRFLTDSQDQSCHIYD